VILLKHQRADERVHLTGDTEVVSSSSTPHTKTPHPRLASQPGLLRVFCDTLKPNGFLGKYLVTLVPFMRLSSNQASTPDKSPLSVSSPSTVLPARTPRYTVPTPCWQGWPVESKPEAEAELAGQTSSQCIVSLVRTPTSNKHLPHHLSRQCRSRRTRFSGL